MCGIIGKIDRYQLNTPLTQKDLVRIKHRGPDDCGIYNDTNVSLGHLRLSIIDLSSGGHQPMQDDQGRYTIVYNGEIYNYLEVRDVLKQEGVLFSSNSDTEVVLKAYIQWGSACLKSFRGMFAFAIWDKKEQIIFMARDRCGEKPFIYFMDDRNFYFSSEFKGIVGLLPEMPRLNPAVVDMYLHYQYAPEPQTLLEKIYKLPAAHYAVLDVRAWTFNMTEYWNISSINADKSITKQDIHDELERAICLNLRSDVEVGVALSAGIDSAGIAAIASRHYQRPLQTFCVGYPGRPAYDERYEAQQIASFLGCRFHEIELATEQFIESFADFSLLLDEPVADIAAYGHYMVPKLCADNGIKVLLTGIGGDEVFWGYDWSRLSVSINQNRICFETIARILGPFMHNRSAYKLLFQLSRTHRISPAFREFCRKVLACVDNAAPSEQLIFMATSGAPEFTKKYKVGKNWYGPAMESIDEKNAYLPTQIERAVSFEDIPVAIMELLFKTWLTSNCLSLGDRVSMAVGVETRLPFLDVVLIEKVIAWRKSNPDHQKGQKTLLRELLSGVLPPSTVQRRKSGFVPPVTKWLSGISNRYGDILKNGYLVNQGIVLPEIKSFFDRDQSCYPHTLYRLILLEQWYRGIVDLYKNGNCVREK